MGQKKRSLADQQRKNSRISLVCSFAVLIILSVCLCQADRILLEKSGQGREAKEAAAEAKEQKGDSAPVVTTADIVAVGDNLFHTKLYESGMNDSGEWNYDHVYEHMIPYIQEADLAFIDQETVLTPNHDEISSYPSFATPQEVGDAVVKAGFDVIETATNHIDDFGLDLIKEELQYWETKHPEVTVIGTNATEEERDVIKTVTVNDITIALLDYTYGTNNCLATGKDAYIINTFDKEQVAADIKRAKEVSDCVIFVAHWGKEEDPVPSEYEKQWATFLMQQGVDVCIGGHPHILQPYGTLSDDQGNEMLIFYSLGNFASTQQDMTGLLGGMAKFTLEKTAVDGKSSVKVISKSVEPLVMHYNHDQGVYGPYLLKDYTNELAAQHSMHEVRTDEFTVETLYELYDEIMSQKVEPSAGTGLLEVHFDGYLNMVDPDGNIVDDTYEGSGGHSDDASSHLTNE